MSKGGPDWQQRPKGDEAVEQGVEADEAWHDWSFAA